MSLSQRGPPQPSCQSEPDEDQEHSTLVHGDSPPTSFQKPAATSVSASSDSGYSSRTGASSSSKTSAGKTPRPPRHTSAASRSKSRSASTDATKKTAPQASAKLSRPSSRSQSHARPPVCSHPDCKNPQCSAKMPPKPKPPPTLETQGRWVPTAPVSPSPLTKNAPYTPSGPPPPPTPTYSAHPPPAIPRPRTQSTARSRPASIAAPGGGSYVPDLSYGTGTTPPPRPPSIHSYSTPQVPGQSTNHAPAALPPSGAWVRVEGGPRSSHPAPPESSRPAITHRPTEPMNIPNSRASMYGAAQLHQYPQATPPGYGVPAHTRDPVRTEMPPPPVPTTYAPPSTLRRPSRDSSGRRPSMDYEYGADYFTNPHGAAVLKRTESRGPHQRTGSRSATYYRETDPRYPGGTTILERSVSRSATRVPRVEKIDHHVRQAREYQDARDSRVINPTDPLLLEKFNQMQIEPTSPSRRRPSQTRHTRSRSRADSSVSRTLTDAGSMRLIMEGNAIQIEGDTEGRSINVRPGDDGVPYVTIGGPSSPTKSREKKYLGGGSQRSGASFAERTGVRTGSGGSPIDGQTLVSEKQQRRRSVITP